MNSVPLKSSNLRPIFSFIVLKVRIATFFFAATCTSNDIECVVSFLFYCISILPKSESLTGSDCFFSVQHLVEQIHYELYLMFV